MSAPGRWLRLDVTCFDSEWLAALPIEAQHAWTRVLLYTKAHGSLGRVKRIGPVAAERLWGIPAVSFQMMEDAAISDDAIRVEDGWWVITGWEKYQQADRTNALRKKRLRENRKHRDTAGMPRSTSGTRHATETLTLTEKETSTPAAGILKSYSPEFEAVWSIHRRGPKQKAFEEYRKAVPARTTHEQLASSLTSYVRREINDRFHGHDLFRWIRDDRWEQYLNGNGSGPSHHDPMRLRTLR